MSCHACISVALAGRWAPLPQSLEHLLVSGPVLNPAEQHCGLGAVTRLLCASVSFSAKWDRAYLPGQEGLMVPQM